jgi:hypothetical protein
MGYRDSYGFHSQVVLPRFRIPFKLPLSKTCYRGSKSELSIKSDYLMDVKKNASYSINVSFSN